MAEHIEAERLREAAEAARLAAEALHNQTILDGLEAQELDRQEDVAGSPTVYTDRAPYCS